MYHQYFKDWEVKPEFKKEFVSLWPGWLGSENLHKLDEVTENEWQRFNQLLVLLSNDFKIEYVNNKKRKTIPISNISSVLSSYKESMNKDATKFSQFIIPELGCVITEEWDYTYIIWHSSNGAVEKLSPYISSVKLCHFT